MDVTTENKVVPKLRFAEFTEDLKENGFAELGKILIGLTHTPNYIESGKIFLSSKNISKGYIDFDNVKYITEAEFEEMTESAKPKKGDILFTRVGSNLGNPIVLEEEIEFAIFVSLGVFRVNSMAINHFIKYWMDTQIFWKQLEQKVAGGAKNNLNTTWLKEFKINTPCLPEQQKIASFLSAVDEKLQQLTKKKELLEEYMKGVMQKIFSQELRFKDANGNSYPDWEEKKLGEIAKVYQPKTISQTDLTEEGYDVYGANGIIGKYHSYNHEFHQIAVTCRGNTCGTVNFTKPYAWITGNAMVVNLDDSDYCNKQFVYFQLYNTNFRYLITGSGQPQITGDIKSHKLKLPSLDEQQKIANFLSSLDRKIELVSTQIENTKAFKKGLLQQMFV